MTTDSIPYPRTLILPTTELLTAFISEIGGPHVLATVDLREILTQVLDLFLDEDPAQGPAWDSVPKYERLVEGHRIESAQFSESVRRFAAALRQQLLDIGAYTLEGVPFYFKQLIGYDIALEAFPPY